MVKKLSLLASVCGLLVGAIFAACGGGGGGDADSIILSGTLTEGSIAVRAKAAGDGIPDVEICALGGCSVTDGLGQWGFDVSPGDDFQGGDVFFTFKGDDIDTNVIVPDISEDIVEAEIDFSLDDTGQISVEDVNTVERPDSSSSSSSSSVGSSSTASSVEVGSSSSSSSSLSSESSQADSSSLSSDDDEEDSSSSDDDEEDSSSSTSNASSSSSPSSSASSSSSVEDEESSESSEDASSADDDDSSSESSD